nr:EOG090X0AVR [Ilyocryptus agilis]
MRAARLRGYAITNRNEVIKLKTYKLATMENETALRLFHEGASLIFLDVPVGTEFGIDLTSWNTGEKFKGVKMIPPGIHFVYYSAVSKEGSVAPRSGFFYDFKKKEIMVRKWEATTEDLEDSSDIISRIEPTQKKICSVADLVPSAVEQKEDESSESRKQRVPRKNVEEQMLPRMECRLGTGLNLTKIPEKSYPLGSSAAEITKYSLDTSYVLEQMISCWETPTQLLGELQMVFLCFLVGEVYTAFEHWKNLLHVFCSADEYLLKNPSFFLDFVGDLYFQMQEVPKDFFVDIVSQNNFLTQTLTIFFGNVLGNEQVDQRLRRRCQQLQQYLTQRFQWDFESMLKHADGFVMKPVQNNQRGKIEIEFYEQVSRSTHPVISQLQNLIPRFLGIHKFGVDNSVNYFIKMEDIAAGSTKPCIADIKIALLRFLNGTTALDRELVSQILSELHAIRIWFEEQRHFLFFATSLLLVYDADLLEKKKSNLNVRVRMIDFAHVYPAHGSRDSNYLHGLCNLIQIFEDFYNDSSPNTTARPATLES